VAGTDVVTENCTPATVHKRQPISIQVNPGKLRAMATECILFDRTLCDRLVQFIAEHGLVADVRPDATEGFVIVVPNTPDEDRMTRRPGVFRAPIVIDPPGGAQPVDTVRSPVAHIARTPAALCGSSASAASSGL
jgi:hypothetical protein